MKTLDTKQPIGIFDSGIGGLTVVRRVLEILPNEALIYFGDTARVPYGSKSSETIKRFSFEITNFLTSKKVKLIIVACNTVSATALKWLRTKFDLPIIGVIEPGAEASLKASKNKKIGVIGTRATIESSAYRKILEAMEPKVKVYSQSCPLLVPLVEEGWIEGLSTMLIIEHYLKGLKNKGIDTLILGCTHYPLLQKEIEKVMGNKVKVIDSATVVALKAKEVLERRGLARAYSNIQTRPKAQGHEGTKSPQVSRFIGNTAGHLFYFSDIPRGFAELSKRFLGQTISYRKVSL